MCKERGHGGRAWTSLQGWLGLRKVHCQLFRQKFPPGSRLWAQILFSLWRPAVGSGSLSLPPASTHVPRLLVGSEPRPGTLTFVAMSAHLLCGYATLGTWGSGDLMGSRLRL